MSKTLRIALIIAALALSLSAAHAAEDPNPFIGRWALTIPGGGAGWLGITQEKGYLDGHILWGGGSVVPVSSVYIADDQLYVTRVRQVQRKDESGKVIRTHAFTETLIAKVSGDTMKLTQTTPRTNGKGATSKKFTGKRTPPLPKKPNLAKARFGKPIQLFNGVDLDGWELTNPRQTSGWSVKNGILTNDVPHERKAWYGNLRTTREFEDFRLSLEVKVSEHGNSGVYLRGIYEVQILDSYGSDLDPHNMGGIYSRIAPTASAEKTFGEWQTMEMTLLDRHVTVILNGTTIIDNQPLLGCTGGALWSDEFRPGPIYLQGDHSSVELRNIILTPIK